MSGYTPELAVQLLPAVWDETYAYGMANPGAPDPDMPRSKADPKIGGTIFAHLADIRWAWSKAPLLHEDRQALFLTHCLDWSQQEISDVQSVDRSSVSRRLSRGLGVLLLALNGKEWQDGDDADDVADDVQV